MWRRYFGCKDCIHVLKKGGEALACDHEELKDRPRVIDRKGLVKLAIW